MSDFDVRYSSIRRALIEREFSRLNDMQQKAVFKTEGPLLLLAGAGSGKTTVLINRIINLLRFGSGYESELAPETAGEEELKKLAYALNDSESLDDLEIASLCAIDPPKPYEIIAITFTNKAAGELKERLEAACGEAAHDIWAHTFHSACTRILRRDISRLGYTKNFTIYDDDDRKKMATSILKDMGYDERRFEVKGITHEISWAKDNLITPEEYASQCGDDYYKKAVARIYAEYQKRMVVANALDFDDIIFKTVELLQKFEDIRTYYQRKFKYVLVDEYQDTNHAQYMLCSILAGGYENLCVVGDDDQSIYKFRGATIENILEFEKQYPSAVTIRLEQNYRSTSSILSAANSVISNNSARKGKTLWTENGIGDTVYLYVGETQDEEGQFIAKTILEGSAKGEKLNGFTVLYRNHALSNSIELSFKRNNIPYRIVAGLRFFDRAEVKDMLAYLWVLSNPADTIRLSRIINTPARKIGGKTIDLLREFAGRDGISMFEAAERCKEYPELARNISALESFTGIINGLRAKKDSIPLIDLYDELLEKSGYADNLREHGHEGRTRMENVLELKSTILEYCDKTESPTLETFLEEVSLVADIDRYDENADAVTMMTMHSAKGLEFDTVFICGAEEGVFPSYRSMDSAEELEEERRICYVAMTRAKKRLYITSAKRRLLYGQTTFGKLSRFVEEIDPEYIHRHIPKIVPAEHHRTILKKQPIKRPPVSVAHMHTETSSNTMSFVKGDLIIHKAFGSGKIVNVTPMGGDVLLEISFDSAGVKLMMAKTASQYISKF
ncbi:MAG: 3'-5' exonuclease [Clostridiaceae bacterium]|nr:3'-5' exonuclease [Clostridiaceae bacterium]